MFRAFFVARADGHTERAIREMAFGRRRRALLFKRRILAANRTTTSPECACADGPSRDIPAHRLAPWGGVNSLSSQEEERRHPLQR
jgi:hypothetical protein